MTNTNDVDANLPKDVWVKPRFHIPLRPIDSAYGAGAASIEAIPKSTVILSFGGPLLSRAEVDEDIYREHHALQLMEDLYLGPTGEIDDLVNHSCEPNCGVFRIDYEYTLVALKPIAAMEELTFDYSTMIEEEGYFMPCLCGSPACRKSIGSFSLLPEATKDYYRKSGANCIERVMRESA